MAQTRVRRSPMANGRDQRVAERRRGEERRPSRPDRLVEKGLNRANSVAVHQGHCRHCCSSAGAPARLQWHRRWLGSGQRSAVVPLHLSEAGSFHPVLTGLFDLGLGPPDPVPVLLHRVRHDRRSHDADHDEGQHPAELAGRSTPHPGRRQADHEDVRGAEGTADVQGDGERPTGAGQETPHRPALRRLRAGRQLHPAGGVDAERGDGRQLFMLAPRWESASCLANSTGGSNPARKGAATFSYVTHPHPERQGRSR